MCIGIVHYTALAQPYITMPMNLFKCANAPLKLVVSVRRLDCLMVTIHQAHPLAYLALVFFSFLGSGPEGADDLCFHT